MGNLTDDAENYEYEYDAFGRLRKIRNQNPVPTLVAEYTYSGLGHRIGWHYDVDADGTVEDTSDDPWIRFVYDERWRIVGTFRASDSSPKEQFVYHNAGADGRGGSSYIDTVTRHSSWRQVALTCRPWPERIWLEETRGVIIRVRAGCN